MQSLNPANCSILSDALLGCYSSVCQVVLVSHLQKLVIAYFRKSAF